MTYEEFIINIRELRENEYFEDSQRHHIIPRCLGGSDNEENLIYLTHEEHFIAHKLLHEENPTNRGLAYAVVIMSNYGELDASSYASVMKMISDSMKGENNPNYRAKSFTDSVKAKMSESHKRWFAEHVHPNYMKPMSLEQREKISNTRIQEKVAKGEKNPMYGVHRYGESSPHYGYIHTGATRKKMSEKAKNRTEEQKVIFARINKGRIASEETRKKLSNSHKGIKMPKRVYQLKCRNCDSEFLANSPSVKYCDSCKEVNSL